MANTNFTKLSVTLLPTEDIQELMRYQYDFITKEDKATDVISVAGIPAQNTAEAINSSDRKTVLNSLRLGGKPADQYMTIEEGGDLSENYDKIKEGYSEEVRDLRDELYQLKAELAKRGLVTNFNHYGGFSDVFQNGDPVYAKDPITTIQKNSINKNEVSLDESIYKALDIGDYIVLHQKDIGRHHVAKITHKLVNGETIRFAPQALYDIKGGDTDVYLSLGMYENGSFIFARQTEKIPTSQNMYSVLNDDTNRQRRNLTSAESGYGYTFRLPDSMFSVDGEPKKEGYLVGIQAKVSRIGTPGPLTAYVIDEKDISKFKSPIQAEDEGILLGKSKPLVPDAPNVERMVTFDFFDGQEYPLLKNDVESDTKARFCLIIEASGTVNASNYYRFMFLQNKDAATGQVGDLQMNNIVYEYTRRPNNSDDAALSTSDQINNADLFYGIITKGVVTNGTVSYREGVYTAKVDLPAPQDASRARLTLRVNREGYYETANPQPTSVRDGDSVLIRKTPVIGDRYDMHELSGVGAKNNDDYVVVGSQIRKVLSQSAESIQVKDGLYLKTINEPVYRVGYKVYLKAIREEYNTNLHRYQEVERIKIELPLSAVMPDRMKRSEKFSDRLVFENEFPGMKRFNRFELQVYWRTEYSAQFEDDKYKEDFMGKIHDLSLSFDRSL